MQLAQFAGRISALGTVGTLLFAVVLRPARPASRLALRANSGWATAWAAATVCHALLTLAQLVGSTITVASLWAFVDDVAAGRSVVVALAAALSIALVARRATRTGEGVALLAIALVGLVVLAVLTGHAATADHHLLAVTNLSVHVVAASVWGGARWRCSPTAAVGCLVATGSSGLLAAWLVLGGTVDGVLTALSSGYGALLIATTVALMAPGVFGRQHRRRSLPRLAPLSRAFHVGRQACRSPAQRG